MAAVELPALRGRNPLGLFAALGVLDVATRHLPERDVRLRWTDELEPTALLQGPDSLDHLIMLCDQDRQRWATSPVLAWGPDGVPLDDLKPTLPELRRWIGVAIEVYRDGDGADLRLLSALVAEGAAAGKNDAKPTHFHFTAGQQKFLVMVRQLQQEVTPAHLREALAGPWTYGSELPVLGWDARGERIWALRGFAPSGEKKTGIPGADWLGFLGLTFFPVALTTDRHGQRRLATTGCTGSWKSGQFTWPLWSVPLSAVVVASVVADTRLHLMSDRERRRLGISTLIQASIRRTDQGGYGSFGPPGPLEPRSGRQDTRRQTFPRARS